MDIPLVSPVLSSSISSGAPTEKSPSAPAAVTQVSPVASVVPGTSTIVQVHPSDETSTGVKVALGILGVSALGIGIYLAKKHIDERAANDAAAAAAVAASANAAVAPSTAATLVSAPSGAKHGGRKAPGHGKLPAVMSGMPASMPVVPTSMPGMPASMPVAPTATPLPVAQQAMGTLSSLGSSGLGGGGLFSSLFGG